MPPSQLQSALVSNMKLDGQFASAAIRVEVDGALVAHLNPIDASIAGNLEVIDHMCRWRAAALSSFLTVFEPSIEKTRAYIEKLVLQDPARILFIITGPGGELIGNIGFCNITEADAEIDNVVRGEKTSVPNFMKHVHAALIDWARDTLGIEQFYLNVLSDNQRAIQSYLNIGYREASSVALSREPIEGGYRLTPSESNAGEITDLRLIRMLLSPSQN